MEVNEEIQVSDPQCDPKEAAINAWIKYSGPFVLLAILFSIGNWFVMLSYEVGVKKFHVSIDNVRDAMMDYLVKHDNHFPPQDHWVEAIFDDGNTQLSQTRFESEKDYFNFILNEGILKYDGSDIPEDVVVLFTGPVGLNQCGGLDMAMRQSKTTVVFKNGWQETWRSSQIPYLNWGNNTPLKYVDYIPLPHGWRYLMAVYSFCVFGVLLWLIYKKRQYLKRALGLAIVISFLSIFVGSHLGMIADMLFYHFTKEVCFRSLYFVPAFSILIAAYYVIVVVEIYKPYCELKNINNLILFIAMITGLIASCLIHVFLMLLHEETSFLYMYYGSGFGLIAGLILGLITCLILLIYKKEWKYRANEVA